MKLFENNTKILRLIVLLVVFIFTAFFIKYYFKPFFIIVILFLLAKPIFIIFSELGIRKEISSVISIVLVNLISFFLIYHFANSLMVKFFQVLGDNQDNITILEDNLKRIFHIDFDSLLRKGAEILTSNITTGAYLTGEGIISYVIGTFTTYFLLVDKRKVINLFSMFISKELIENINIRLCKLREVLKIEVLLVLITTIMIIIGFKILRIPNVVLLGIICGIFDILPYVGTIIVFIPIIIYNIIMKQYLIAIGLVALYFITQIIREILELKYLSSKLDIHPLVIMLSIYIGAKIFGVMGLIIGPVYCLVAKDIIYD